MSERTPRECTERRNKQDSSDANRDLHREGCKNRNTDVEICGGSQLYTLLRTLHGSYGNTYVHMGLFCVKTARSCVRGERPAGYRGCRRADECTA
jgi:hypothetical protein